MATYRTRGVVGFNAGAVLSLSEGQAAARRHALEPIGGKKYRVAARVEFKAGEVIGIDGEPDKATAAKLDAIDKPARANKSRQLTAASQAPTPGDTASLDIG